MKIGKIIFLGLIVASWAVRAEVVMDTLPEMQVGTIGFETGLKSDIWGEHPNADDILEQVRSSTNVMLNDSEKEIFKRILLTDMGGMGVLEERKEAYLTERVRAFLAQNMADEALQLLDKVPTKNMSKELKQLKAEVLFAAGQNDKACSENLLEAFAEKEAFIRAVCADLIGVPPQSALAYEVYRESGEDTFAFFNAAGEVLFRNLDSKLPEGIPSVWEMPLVVRAFGVEALNTDMPKENLWVLLNQKSVSNEVKEKVRENLMRFQGSDTNALAHLVQMANHRNGLERVIKNTDAK